MAKKIILMLLVVLCFVFASSATAKAPSQNHSDDTYYITIGEVSRVRLFNSSEQGYIVITLQNGRELVFEPETPSAFTVGDVVAVVLSDWGTPEQYYDDYVVDFSVVRNAIG